MPRLHDAIAKLDKKHGFTTLLMNDYYRHALMNAREKFDMGEAYFALHDFREKLQEHLRENDDSFKRQAWRLKFLRPVASVISVASGAATIALGALFALTGFGPALAIFPFTLGIAILAGEPAFSKAAAKKTINGRKEKQQSQFQRETRIIQRLDEEADEAMRGIERNIQAGEIVNSPRLAELVAVPRIKMRLDSSLPKPAVITTVAPMSAPISPEEGSNEMKQQSQTDSVKQYVEEQGYARLVRDFYDEKMAGAVSQQDVGEKYFSLAELLAALGRHGQEGQRSMKRIDAIDKGFFTVAAKGGLLTGGLYVAGIAIVTAVSISVAPVMAVAATVAAVAGATGMAISFLPPVKKFFRNRTFLKHRQQLEKQEQVIEDFAARTVNEMAAIENQAPVEDIVRSARMADLMHVPPFVNNVRLAFNTEAAKAQPQPAVVAAATPAGRVSPSAPGA